MTSHAKKLQISNMIAILSRNYYVQNKSKIIIFLFGLVYFIVVELFNKKLIISISELKYI